MAASQVKLSLGHDCNFSGIIFSYDNTGDPIVPYISIGKSAKIIGQIYSQGILELQDMTEVDGSVFTSKFIYKTTVTLFENYLINSTINSRALSPYYLTSGLLPVAGKKKKILQWLQAN